MPECMCDSCVHCKFMKGHQRGVMDCDPDEWWCSMDEDGFGDEEMTECESYKEIKEYDWYY